MNNLAKFEPKDVLSAIENYTKAYNYYVPIWKSFLKMKKANTYRKWWFIFPYITNEFDDIYMRKYLDIDFDLLLVNSPDAYFGYVQFWNNPDYYNGLKNQAQSTTCMYLDQSTTRFVTKWKDHTLYKCREIILKELDNLNKPSNISSIK